MKDHLKDIRNFLIDMDGTLYLGDRVLPGAIDFLHALRSRGRRFLLLTNNSSRSVAEYEARLSAMGFPAAADNIFSSATATILYLQRERPGARVFLLATPGVTAEFAAVGLVPTDCDPEFVVLTFDKTLTYAKVEAACRFIRRGVPFVATHPDLVCPTGDFPIPDCGSMIRMIAAATGVEPKIIGKPNPEMVEFALQTLAARPEETAIIGDRLYTDMEMGFRAGLTTVLVLSGEATAEMVERHGRKPDFVRGSIRDIVDLVT